MAEDLQCWKCGASIAELTLPLRRLEECLSCETELHVCRMCQFYDRNVAKHCQEPIAEEVKDKTRANFCDYFTPRPGAYIPVDPVAAAAKSELASLFDDNAEKVPEDPNRDAWEQLQELLEDD